MLFCRPVERTDVHSFLGSAPMNGSSSLYNGLAWGSCSIVKSKAKTHPSKMESATSTALGTTAAVTKRNTPTPSRSLSAKTKNRAPCSICRKLRRRVSLKYGFFAGNLALNKTVQCEGGYPCKTCQSKKHRAQAGSCCPLRKPSQSRLDDGEILINAQVSEMMCGIEWQQY